MMAKLNSLKNFKLSRIVRLRCWLRGKSKYTSNEIQDDDLLFRDFRKRDLMDGVIEPASLGMPDMSCNWSRFSKPKDIRFRENADPNSGVLAIKAADARHMNFATPCHDPICESLTTSNYSHIEIRENEPNQAGEPAKRFKKGGKVAKKNRLAWRTHIILNATILVKPTNP